MLAQRNGTRVHDSGRYPSSRDTRRARVDPCECRYPLLDTCALSGNPRAGSPSNRPLQSRSCSMRFRTEIEVEVLLDRMSAASFPASDPPQFDGLALCLKTEPE